MSNEEFQKIVLEEFQKLNEKVGNIEQRLTSLEQGQANLEQRLTSLEQGQGNLEQGQADIRKDLESVISQTMDLTEFRVETNEKLDKVIDRLYSVEMITAQNWQDIAKIKLAK